MVFGPESGRSTGDSVSFQAIMPSSGDALVSMDIDPDAVSIQPIEFSSQQPDLGESPFDGDPEVIVPGRGLLVD